MKRLAMILVLSTGLVTGPAMASHDGEPLLNRENVGGAIGAVIGGFAGNKLVDGDGKPIATAAGAVGGYIVGRDIGHNYGGGSYGRAGRQVYQSSGGYDQRVTTRTHSYGSSQRYAHNNCGSCGSDSRRSFPVHPINEKYIATCTSNVRTGPSTRYHVMDQVRERELVIVIGKVRGRNWYKVRVGHRIGYIYAPLLEPAYYSQNRYNDNGGGWYR